MGNYRPPLQCKKCGAPLKEKKGISKKNGKPFHFWGCSNYPTCDYVLNPPTKEELRHQKIMEALGKLWSKIDELDKKIKNINEFFINKNNEQ